MSLAVGVLVGVIYSLVNVRSPAPPIIALVGLFGILAGEQAPAVARAVWRREPIVMTWLTQIHPHVFGHLPMRRQARLEAGDGTPASARLR